MPRTTITSADITDATIVTADVSTSAAIEQSKLVEVAASDLATTLDLSSKTVSLPSAAVTAHVTPTDTSSIENNIALLAFQVAANASLAKFGMVDSAVDTFTDNTGIDTGNSTNATPISGAIGGGTILDDTALLIHPTGANSATSWTTDDSTGHTMTAGLSVEISTSTVKFSPNSIVFSGTNNQKATIPHHTDFVLGSGDFTIDFWIRFYNMTMGGGCANGIIGHGTDDSAADFNWYLALYVGTKMYFRYSDGSTITTIDSGGDTAFNQNQWYHLAVVRSGTNMYFFRDGVVFGSTQAIGSPTIASTSRPFMLGDDAFDWDTNLVGYMDEVRISKAARWTSAFDVPTAEYGSAVASDYTLISTTTTAEATATTVDLVFLLETVGTVILGTDIKAYVSRNGNANYSASLTLVDEGDWGTNKKIIVARGIDVSSLAGTTAMRYKITTHNQSSAKQCKVHGVSLAWS